jgi:hypothetical protein
MMFRKLYWVTEAVDSQGHSHVAGVFTSIPELLRRGLTNIGSGAKLRLTLAKLDGDTGPFGTWSEPEFSGLGEKLQEFVETDEFSAEHCQMLLESLNQRARLAA